MGVAYTFYYTHTQKKDDDTREWVNERAFKTHKQFMAKLTELQSSQDSNGDEAGTSENNHIDELSLWVDVVGGKKRRRVFGLGGAAGLVGNGFFGGSLPKNSYWEKQFEDQVQKTAVMEEKLMAATTRLEEMEKLIRSLHIPPGFQQRVGGTDTEAVEKDTDESSSEDEGSEHEET